MLRNQVLGPAIMNAMKTTENQRHAIVTGGASGLGRAFCLHLAQQRWHLAIADIDSVGSEQTLELVERHRGTGQIELLDVADYEAWQELVARLRNSWPRLDLLVNNAGICGAGLVGEFSLSDFRKILDVNLMGAINGCQACVPWLRETAPGARLSILGRSPPYFPPQPWRHITSLRRGSSDCPRPCTASSRGLAST